MAHRIINKSLRPEILARGPDDTLHGVHTVSSVLAELFFVFTGPAAFSHHSQRVAGECSGAEEKM